MRQIEVINQETIIDVTAETSNVEILVRDYDSELVERFALEAQEAAIEAEESADIATAQASIATAQATIATTQAGIATTQAGIATTQAGIATTKANEASASAASALASEQAADADRIAAQAAASTATTQAGIATTQAGIATTKAGEASASAAAALASETDAETAASTATTQAGIATTQAGIATTQAGIATTQASNALTSANNAAASAASAAQVGTSTPLTGFSTGANSTILATDTILQGFNKTQGQINARVSGTIATGQVAFGTAANTVGGDAGLTWNNTNKRLSIGGSSINSSALTVRSNEGSTLSLRSETGACVIGGTLLASNTYLWLFGDTAGISGGSLNESVTIFSRENLRFFISGSERLRFFNSGNIGINTTTDAGFRLDVNGTARVQGQTQIKSNITGTATSTLRIDNGGTALNEVSLEFFSSASDSAGSVRSGRIKSYFTGPSFASSFLTFQSVTTGNALIDTLSLNNGNVLIGTTTVSAFKLDVNGTARVQGNLTTNLTAGSVPFIGASGLLSQDNSTLFWDNTNKRLGIGTTTPATALEVVGVSRLRGGIEVFNESRIINVNSGGGIRFNTGGSISIQNASNVEFVRFINGNVILQNGGTFTDAGFRLDVNGTARVQGVLTTTADAVVNGVNIGIGGGSGVTNTRVGVGALRDNTTGSANTAFGRDSLRDNTTGSNNTANGFQALYLKTTGSANTAFGFNAGRFLADGVTNLTIANNSVFIGASTKALADNQSNQIVIGNDAIGLGSNTTVIGNSSTTFGRWFGNLLVGSSTNSGQQLQVTGTSLLNGLSTIQGTAASDSGQLGSELLTTGTGDASWTGTSFATGYTHVAGSTTTLTSTLAGVVNTFYQITYTVTGRTAGSFTIAFGGFISGNLTATGAVGPRATTTDSVVITPTSDFNGTIVLSIRVITSSSASVSFNSSSGTTTNQIRISNIETNTFFGNFSGRTNTTGSSNSFFGNNAGINNTTGSNNSFFGRNSGLNNNIASNNSFFGLSCGSANTTGASNSFYGAGTGQSNTTGGSNSFFGQASGLANTTASSNSFFGTASGGVNTTGGANSFFGTSSGNSNTTGGSNAFFGVSSGFANTTDGNNSFFGTSAGSNKIAGANNSFFGSNAGRFTGTGTTAMTSVSNSLYLGYQTRGLNATGSTNEVVIGYDVVGLGSNTTVLGNTSTTHGRWYGSLLLGTTTNAASSILTMESTTQGVLFPRMTTTQKNAIASPATGLVVYDNTLNKLSVFTGLVWETVTSL
jgi:multidrug efflux pump subunit AcrA (membrane-fusion protein)